jgi:hypothetical protein
MTYAISKTNQKLLANSKALEKIHEHNRGYLSLTLTIPLGNKALKNVHTNQWLFTNLPKEFDLANWTVLAEALNSNANRFEGYVANRWYIGAVDINVEADGKAEMKLTVNAFASSYKDYASEARELQKAYTDAKANQEKQKNSSKNKSTAVAKNTSVLNQSNIKKYKIPKAVYSIAESVCKGKKTDKEKAYALYQWEDKHVTWWSYTDHKYSPEQVIKQGGGNCVDNSRLYRLLCLSVGLKCNFVKGYSCCSGGECANHQWNKVYINGKGVTVDCGRTNASWGSHWGNCSGGSKETTSSW